MKTISSILVIDDNHADAYLAKRALIRAKAINDEADIFFATDGEDALNFLSDIDQKRALYGADKFPPTLILLDINMPIMNGFEFLDEYQSLNKQAAYNSIIVMMLTSSENPCDLTKASDYDCVKDFIVKPLSKEKISHIMVSCFEG
ncbi:response regulator [Pseudoalteromonas sp. MMG013]|uniref:response regulator n=1 Tax=unclassified Pseudoalteromonas TaxID=194690 RepID=UPI001B37DC01|nr:MULTISPECIES: response regulator [unclassified Pseudoalteromonas]MBQ4850530.1 response regulator [Pseudoalteromonas sp. MMG012]MBQ4862169.1 response regulator [Pseudoalteromonas sp. MMG013]